MPKIGRFSIGKLGLNTAVIHKININTVIEKWVKKHTSFWYDVKRQGCTNEDLKKDSYLQDFSGNERHLKLNNFLFSGMSGIGGYSIQAKSFHNRGGLVGVFEDYYINIKAQIWDDLEFVWTPDGKNDRIELNSGETIIRPSFTVKIEGLPENMKWGIYEYSQTEFPYENGVFTIPEYRHTNVTDETETIFCGITFSKSLFDNVDIKITFMPLYPDALVTNGIDNYGETENFYQGIRMLFFTCNPFSLNKMFYDQKGGGNIFAIYNETSTIAYNKENFNGVTYINGSLNKTLKSEDLINKKQIITISSLEAISLSTTPIFFANGSINDYFSDMAFYSAIGFDKVPNIYEDGFTPEELINYYVPRIIATITVIDENGNPIVGANVSINYVNYTTLDDGTVKIEGVSNSLNILSVTNNGYMSYNNDQWKLSDTTIIMEPIYDAILSENKKYMIAENNDLILLEKYGR